MGRHTGIVVAVFALAAATAAAAQSPSPDSAPAEKQAPTSLQNSGGDLSGKLSRSGGVITPSGNIDPGIGKSAPDPRPNSMPVIPPSATGGGSAK